jgi:hypothetical protein
MKRLVWALLIGTVGISPALAEKPKKIPKQYQQLMALTPEQFRTSATLKDDDLETVATITTQPGWQQKDGLLKIVNSDEYFRAFIDKKTGKTTFQVYKYVRYYGDWAFFQTVNHETPSGPISQELNVISRDVGTCNKYLGCEHTETFGFNVDETLLRQIAAKYVAGQSVTSVWRFRLKAKSGVQRDEAFVPAEVAGLLAAVDSYKRQKNLPSSLSAT